MVFEYLNWPNIGLEYFRPKSNIFLNILDYTLIY